MNQIVIENHRRATTSWKTAETFGKEHIPDLKSEKEVARFSNLKAEFSATPPRKGSLLNFEELK